jgi:hypothetical protein
MRRRLGIALVSVFFATSWQQAAASTASGAYDVNATASAVCTLGYARRHRKVPYRIRDRVYNAYGLARGHRRGYVIDHLIPLELGGANAIANLWPQPRPESKRKDRDEGRLHDQVCNGEITLAGARAEMIRLWRR